MPKVTEGKVGKPKKLWVWQSPWEAEKTDSHIINKFFEGKAGWNWVYHVDLMSLDDALSLLVTHGKISEVEVSKETKARYYIDNPRKDEKPRWVVPSKRYVYRKGGVIIRQAKPPYRVKPQQHFILNKDNLKKHGWDICPPLRRILYNTKRQAENLSFYKSQYYKSVAPGRERSEAFWQGYFGGGGNTIESVDPAEVKAVWRKLVKQFHPDHGGSHQEFDIIQKAFKPLLK